MAKLEGLQCDNITIAPYSETKASQHSLASLWSCITNLRKWTDIIKSSNKTNNAITQNVSNKFKKISGKQKNQATSISLPQPVFYNNDPSKINTTKGIKYTTIKKRNVNSDPTNDNTIQIVTKKVIKYKNPTLHRTIKKEVYKTSSQEIFTSSNKENGNIHWIQNVSVHEFYKVKKGLDGDEKEKQKQKRKGDTKSRIILSLLQKIKTLETQIREIQFLNKTNRNNPEKLKKITKNKTNKDETNNLKEDKDERYETFNLLKFKGKTDLELNNCKFPVIKFKNRKPINQDTKIENGTVKTEQKSQRDTSTNIYNRYKIKQGSSVDRPGIPSTSLKAKKYNVQSQNTLSKNSEQESAVWLPILFKRIRSLEKELKTFGHTTKQLPIINPYHINNGQNIYTCKKSKTDLNKNKFKKLINVNVFQQKSENFRTHNLYELCFSSHPKIKENQKNHDDDDNVGRQENNLLTLHTRLDKQSHRHQNEETIYEIVKEIRNEKITQTSKDYFTKLSKTDIKDNIQLQTFSTTEIDTNNEILTKGQEKDKLETKFLTESQLDDQLIKIQKVRRYTSRTAKEQDDSGYDTKEKTNNGYDYDEGESKCDNKENEVTDNFTNTTTTGDENCDSETSVQDKVNKSESNKKIIRTTLSYITEKSGENDDNNNDETKDNDDEEENNSIGSTVSSHTYNLFQQKNYISAKERKKINEDTIKQQHQIYGQLMYRNINYRNNLNIFNDRDNSLLQIELLSRRHRPTISVTSSSAKSGDFITNKKTDDSTVISYPHLHRSQLTLQSSENNYISKPLYSGLSITECPSSHDDRSNCNILLKNNMNNYPVVKNELVCPDVSRFSFINRYKEEDLIKKNMTGDWPSTGINTMSSDFIKEIKKCKMEMDSPLLKKKLRNNITEVDNLTKTDSSVMMSVLQLSKQQFAVKNVSNIFMVLVSDDKNEKPKEINEDEIRKIVSNLRNSIEDFIMEESNGSTKSTIENNNFKEITFKEEKNTKISSENVKARTRNNNKSDSQMFVKKADKSAKVNYKSDSEVIPEKSKICDLDTTIEQSKKCNSNKKTKQNKTCDSDITVREDKKCDSDAITIESKVVMTDGKQLRESNTKDFVKKKKSKTQKLKTKKNSSDTKTSRRCQCIITGTNVCFPPLNYIEYELSTSRISETTDKSSDSCKIYTNVYRHKDKEEFNLKKRMDYQDEQISELKNMWNKCVNMLERAFKTKTHFNNVPSLSSIPSFDYQSNSSNSHPLVKINPDNNDSKKKNKAKSKPRSSDTFYTFVDRSESDITLSGILSDSKENNRTGSVKTLISTEWLRQPFTEDFIYENNDKQTRKRNKTKMFKNVGSNTSSEILCTKCNSCANGSVKSSDSERTWILNSEKSTQTPNKASRSKSEGDRPTMEEIRHDCLKNNRATTQQVKAKKNKAKSITFNFGRNRNIDY